MKWEQTNNRFGNFHFDTLLFVVLSTFDNVLREATKM